MPISIKTYSCSGEGGLKESHRLGDLPSECDQCLKYLNSCKLLVEVTTAFDVASGEYILDKDTNRSSGSARAFQHLDFLGKVHELNLEHLFMYVKRFEGIAAQFSIMYHTKIVKERVPDVKSLEKAEEFSEAVAAQRMTQRPKKEKKQLSERDRAIQVLTGVGVSLAAATAEVDKRFKEQGKVTS